MNFRNQATFDVSGHFRKFSQSAILLFFFFSRAKKQNKKLKTDTNNNYKDNFMTRLTSQRKISHVLRTVFLLFSFAKAVNIFVMCTMLFCFLLHKWNGEAINFALLVPSCLSNRKSVKIFRHFQRIKWLACQHNNCKSGCHHREGHTSEWPNGERVFMSLEK